jgi:hypothetical protein
MQLAAGGMRQCARAAGGGQGCLAHRSIVIMDPSERLSSERLSSRNLPELQQLIAQLQRRTGSCYFMRLTPTLL